MEEKKFWFDFSGSTLIKAADEETAKEIFMEWLNRNAIKYVEISDIEEFSKD